MWLYNLNLIGDFGDVTCARGGTVREVAQTSTILPIYFRQPTFLSVRIGCIGARSVKTTCAPV